MTPAAPTTDQSIVALTGVTKHFASGTRALDGLDLAIASGEFVSLLGPSGCGKSTALRLIAGLGKPTSGSIDWPLALHDAHGEPEREIGFVFQEPTLMPWRTVFGNVYLPLKMAHLKRRNVRERVMDALAM